VKRKQEMADMTENTGSYRTANMHLSLGAQRLGVNYGSLRAILEGAPADGSGGD
jgi:hypothetical protein